MLSFAESLFSSSSVRFLLLLPGPDDAADAGSFVFLPSMMAVLTLHSPAQGESRLEAASLNPELADRIVHESVSHSAKFLHENSANFHRARFQHDS